MSDKSFEELARALQEQALGTDARLVGAAAYAQAKIVDAQIGAICDLLITRGYLSRTAINAALEAKFREKVEEMRQPQIVMASAINGSKRP